MASIKRNFFYSSILTTANYIFPFITYPYVSRVLGVTNIGICNFVDSIINYFILFSMMGIGTIGVREIAGCKSKEERDKVFSGLFALNTLSTTIVAIVLLVAVLYIPKLYEYKELIFFGTLKLIGNYLLVEWLYRGIEDFKFITVRTITIKVLYVISVFIFVQEKSDYKIYYLLLSLMVIINALINIVYARKFISFTFNGLSLQLYLKPFLILGGYLLLTSMYTSFNVAYLGFEAGETEVGYYTTATKLYSILLALFTAFTTVLLPRMSHLIGENKVEDFKLLLNKSIDILLAFSIPLIMLSTIMAPQIIFIISGAGYEGAILPMRIVMPLMLIIGYEQILVVQTLMPLKKDRAILINSIIGACVGLLMNILLVRTFQSVGSSIVWVISEVSVLCCAQYFVTKYIRVIFPAKKILISVIYNLPLLFIIHAIGKLNIGSDILQLAIASVISLAYSFILQFYVMKNSILVSFVLKTLKK